MFYENKISEPAPSHFQVGWEITSDHIYLWSPLNDSTQRRNFVSFSWTIDWLLRQHEVSPLQNCDNSQTSGLLLAVGRPTELMQSSYLLSCQGPVGKNQWWFMQHSSWRDEDGMIRVMYGEVYLLLLCACLHYYKCSVTLLVTPL